MSVGQRRTAAMGMAALAVAALILVLIVRDNQVDRRVLTEGQPVTATAIDERRVGRSTVNDIRYNHRGGSYSSLVYCGNQCYPAGSRVTIYLHPSDPRRFVTDSGLSSTRWKGWAYAVVLVMGGMGLYGVIASTVIRDD